MFRRIILALVLVSLVPCIPAVAGPPGASGQFDINNIDCDNIDQLDPRFQRIARRKCDEGKPNYVISNQGSIDSQMTPPDVYTGKDKKSLEKLVLEAWRGKYPKDEILGLRFHMKDWKRDANYKANSTSIYKTDTSVLAVSVVVKDSPELATIFPAYINKDNLDGSVNAGVATKTSEYVVKQMLVRNWNP